MRQEGIRQHHRTGGVVAVIYRSVAGSGVTDFHGFRQAGHGNDYFGDAADYACHDAFGDGVPGGKYTRRAARRFLYHSGPLVYFRCAQADDRRVAFPGGMDGGGYFGRDDGIPCGCGFEKV